MKHRVDIIGAGISGLATAFYLTKAFQEQTGRSDASLDMHVWEREARPGGLAGTFTTSDFTVEKFYHHIFCRDVALQELIKELGFGDDLLWRPAATGAYYFRQPYRLSAPLDLLRFKPLPFFDRFRLGWLALHARTIRDWRQLDDISVKDYILKVAGERVYRIVWEPLFHGKFGDYTDSISAAWLWSKLVDRGGSRNRQGHELLGYLRGGLGRVFDALVQRLQESGHTVHLGQTVHRLEGSPQHITALVTDEGTVPTDVVIGCAQTPDLAHILPDSANTYRASLDRIKFLANVCLVLTLKQSLSDFYWTNVTDVNAPFVGIIEQTNWADADDFNRKHIVYVSAYVTPDDPRLSMTAEELGDLYLPSIRKMFPTFNLDLIETQTVWKAPYAQPIVHIGYRHSIPDIVAPISNLFVCTMAQIYPHDRQISNGIELARKTAECVKRYCETLSS
jgi:protoporphyrinogen oxidase